MKLIISKIKAIILGEKTVESIMGKFLSVVKELEEHMSFHSKVSDEIKNEIVSMQTKQATHDAEVKAAEAQIAQVKAVFTITSI